MRKANPYKIKLHKGTLLVISALLGGALVSSTLSSKVFAVENHADDSDSAWEITEETYAEDQEILAMEGYDFSDCRIALIGDSITYGNGGSLQADGTRVNYTDTMQELLGCEITNLAIGGATVGSYGGNTSLYHEMYSIPEDADIIIIFGGVNDYLWNLQDLGTLYETGNTYRNDMTDIMKYLSDNYPSADLFYITIYRSALEETAFQDEVPYHALQEYMTIGKHIANAYGANVIDLYSTEFMDCHNEEIKLAYFHDDIHPDDNGSRILGTHIAAELVRWQLDDNN